MLETESSSNDSLIGQLRNVIKDAIDYLASVAALAQARMVEMTLSSMVFIGLFVLAVLSLMVAFVLLSVALGFWLTSLTGHVGWALLIMGGVYTIIGTVCGSIGVRWLNQLKS